MLPTVSTAPMRPATVDPLPAQRPPAEPAQGLAARRVSILQMPQTLCSLAYAVASTGIMAAGSAACFILGNQARGNPESEYMGRALQNLGASLAFGTFFTAGATIRAVQNAYADERQALAGAREPGVQAIQMEDGALDEREASVEGEDESQNSQPGAPDGIAVPVPVPIPGQTDDGTPEQ
ncbi:MAG: hypothetical protein ACOVK6_02725 [Ramlibacter sp.]|jgi:hypothetical protein